MLRRPYMSNILLENYEQLVVKKPLNKLLSHRCVLLIADGRRGK